MKKAFLYGIGLVIAAVAAAQPPQATMKAVVVSEYGGPEVLKYQDAPRPEPNNDEILVRVIAAGVNPVDAYVRQGKFGNRSRDNRPSIVGYDIAGVVEKTGANI